MICMYIYVCICIYVYMICAEHVVYTTCGSRGGLQKSISPQGQWYSKVKISLKHGFEGFYPHLHSGVVRRGSLPPMEKWRAVDFDFPRIVNLAPYT